MINYLLENIYLVWFLLSFIFIVGELFLPGFVVIFFGVASFIIAIETMIFQVHPSLQLLQFIFFSGVLLFIFHKFFRKETKEISSFDSEIQKRVVKVTQDIVPPKSGKVLFKGSEWSAESDEKILAGEMVEVIDYESIRLIVKKKKNY